MSIKKTLSAFCASVSDPAVVRAVSYEMTKSGVSGSDLKPQV